VSFQSRRAVTYVRVSTARQGASGLGLDAQRSAVQAYAASVGVSIVAEFVEVESGKRADRPQLTAALAACRLHHATLIIAKLDRLARNVHFISGLMESKCEFVAVDMPHANRLTLHLMAAMAEHEAAAISERTKAALAAAKARGVRLGNPNGAAHLRAGCRDAALKGAALRDVARTSLRRNLEQLITNLSVNELASAATVARALNQRQIPSPTGGTWYRQQVTRLGLVNSGNSNFS
jgi:DNA invertase Pin-like site-specific DNA recombinase